MPGGLVEPNRCYLNVAKNPHLVDWYFSARLDDFFRFFLKMFLTLNGYGTAMNGSLEPHSRAWCSQATNDPVTPTLVATTYSGRLAEEQMEKFSVFNRDYFE